MNDVKRRVAWVTTCVGIAILIFSVAWAQPPGQPFPPGQRPGGFRDPPGFLLTAALDTDKDGKISSSEIANSTKALQKLDKDGDGKLSAQEIGWPPARPFPGPGGPGGRGGGFPGFGRQPGPPQRPESKQPGGDTAASPRRRFFSPAQIQSIDRNGDGKILKEEIPKQLQQRILLRLDKNNDDVIDEKELAAFAKAERANNPQDAPKK